jgi:hypothetical protein
MRQMYSCKANSGGSNERVDLPHWFDCGDYVHSFISWDSLSETAKINDRHNGGFRVSGAKQSRRARRSLWPDIS